MAEDAFYRTSTQYRLWSFTPASLLSLRTKTNQLATVRVQTAVQRIRDARSSTETSEGEGGTPASTRGGEREREGEREGQEDVDCLTVDEELKLLRYYCGTLLKMAEEFGMPAEAKATAVQYLKRFYLTNSIMTYPPKTMLKTALFFATKTEHHYTPVKDFAARIANTEAEEILASEFILTQGLRFTFDVRHPLRAHVGMTMELQAMAAGKLDSGSSSSSSSSIPADLEARVGKAYGAIRSVLKTHAQVTDVYFHYTPSQICFAAMYLADASLATWYLGVKMAGEQHEAGVRAVQTVQRCAAMLREYDSLGMGEPSSEEKKELRRLTKKLGKCMDPEKMDLVGLQRAKREGADDLEGDKRAKKRKLERESVQQEGADLFGPALGVSRA